MFFRTVPLPVHTIDGHEACKSVMLDAFLDSRIFRTDRGMDPVEELISHGLMGKSLLRQTLWWCGFIILSSYNVLHDLLAYRSYYAGMWEKCLFGLMFLEAVSRRQPYYSSVLAVGKFKPEEECPVSLAFEVCMVGEDKKRFSSPSNQCPQFSMATYVYD